MACDDEVCAFVATEVALGFLSACAGLRVSTLLLPIRICYTAVALEVTVGI